MISKIHQKYKETTDLNRFLLKGGFLFLIWRGFRKWLMLRGQYMEFTEVWAKVYLKIAKFFLDVLGYDTTVDYPSRKLWLTGSSNAIEVVFDCLGINLFVIFMIFTIAYPGKVKVKSWFIPLGFSVIFLLNAMRMAALTPIVAQRPDLMDLFHHFILQGVIYIGIFMMWWWFTRITQK